MGELLCWVGIEFEPLGLPVRPAVAAGVDALGPLEAQPAQIVDHGLLGRLRRSIEVGVLDPQDERAAVPAGQQPVEERRPRVADVKLARGAWCESDPHVLPAGLKTRPTYCRPRLPTPRGRSATARAAL